MIYINSTRSFDNPNHDSTSTFRPSSSSSSLNITSNNQNNPSPSSSSSMFMIDAYEGEKIIIVCTVPYAKPPPRLKWYRKNIELLPGKFSNFLFILFDCFFTFEIFLICCLKNG